MCPVSSWTAIIEDSRPRFGGFNSRGPTRQSIVVECIHEIRGAKCSSVVRAFAHGAMDRRIDPSWAISCSSQSSTTGVTKSVVSSSLSLGWQGRKEMFYLTTHSTHFIYGYMASNIWLRTILTVRKETRCRHIGYSFRLTARVILYAPSHRHDCT